MPTAKLYKQRQQRACVSSSSASSAVPGYHVTPGTAFMQSLTQALHNFCSQYLSSTQDSTSLQALVWPSGTLGEAKMKITNAVIAKCRQHSNHMHIIVGGDGDGILLGMASLVPNVYVYYKSWPSLHKGGVSNTSCLSHLKLLEGLIRAIYPAPHTPSFVSQSSASLFCLDFVILTTFAGNDYLPPVAENFDANFQAFAALQHPKTRHLMKVYGDCPVEPAHAPPVYIVLDFANYLALLQKIGDVASVSSAGAIEEYLWGLTWLTNMYINGLCTEHAYWCLDKRISVGALRAYLEGLQGTPSQGGGTMLDDLQQRTVERVAGCIGNVGHNLPFVPLKFLLSRMGLAHADAVPPRLVSALQGGIA